MEQRANVKGQHKTLSSSSHALHLPLPTAAPLAGGELMTTATYSTSSPLASFFHPRP